MKISTHVRYGARLMFRLALEYGKGFSLLKDIAKQEGLSEKYLSLIVIPLKAKGLILSARGAKGGYVLSKAPSAISMWDIVSALDGDLSEPKCLTNQKRCKRYETCVMRDVWKQLEENIQKTLSSITLQNLVEMHEKNQDMSIDYII
ncbi:MAG: Rrf2 family transcriptional regulator [Candidatus Nanoarchaeia archaeon]